MDTYTTPGSFEAQRAALRLMIDIDRLKPFKHRVDCEDPRVLFSSDPGQEGDYVVKQLLNRRAIRTTVRGSRWST
jgi:hypothetical protein